MSQVWNFQKFERPLIFIFYRHWICKNFDRSFAGTSFYSKFSWPLIYKTFNRHKLKFFQRSAIFRNFSTSLQRLRNFKNITSFLEFSKIYIRLGSKFSRIFTKKPLTVFVQACKKMLKIFWKNFRKQTNFISFHPNFYHGSY